MCKTGKKNLNKINFNKFIWFTGNWKIYIYIYIIFFGWFSSNWSEKKKKNVAGCCWATAHFQHALGHDRAICIVTQRLGRLAWAQPGGHDTAQRTPRHGAQLALCSRPGRSARAVGAQPGFKVCIWCTQPSFGLSALFQSLFGTLFMRTVHEDLKIIIK